MHNQVQLVTLDELVPESHQYRKLKSLLPLNKLLKPLEKAINTELGPQGYGVHTLFSALIIQYMEDLSDRELARYLQENNAAKWFCQLDLTAKTPSFTLFSKVRKRIGTSRLSKLFQAINKTLQQDGYLKNLFTFVDSSHLVAKEQLWQERDKALAQRYETLNNKVLPEVALDKDARIGCKGKQKYWYGYKKHVSVDMQSGLIKKVAVTPANTSDSQGLGNVCPRDSIVYADKAYCGAQAQKHMARNSCENASIKRKNMTGKDKQGDHYRSKMRSPYERIFTKLSRRCKYRGLVKGQFQMFFEALCFNFKRLLSLQNLGHIPLCYSL